MLIFNKSWFLPALFLPIISILLPLKPANAGLDIIDIERIANSEQWKALLHVKNGEPTIKDPQFLLSHHDFSLVNELIATQTFFTNNDTQAICRFPARHLYLSQFDGLLPQNHSNLTECPEFEKYLNKVPFDKLSLVYASEVLSSASSMMGHIFLKAEGINDNQNSVEHSISFFTEYDTYNPFRLIYDGLVGGMNGFFIVRQFQRDLDHYSQSEQRNVFEYEISFSEFSIQLIQFHIWELKDVDINYLFQSYNCATLTLYLLSLGDFDLREAEILFVSPSDVVKALEKESLLKNAVVTLSNKFEQSLLKQELGSKVSNDVERMFFNPSSLSKFNDTVPENKQALSWKYISVLSNNKDIENRLSQSEREILSSFTKKNQIDSKNQQKFTVDFSKHKNPVNSAQDTIFSSSILRQNDRNILELAFLPASHYLRSYNPQFLSESSLEIGATTLRVDTATGNLKIHEFALYSVVSLVPTNSLQPETSGSFYIGYRQSLNQILEEEGFANIAGGLGKTYKPHRDVMIYGMLNAGLGVNFSGTLAYLEPEIGGIFKLIGSSKLMLKHSYTNSNISKNDYRTSKIEFSKNLWEHVTVSILYKHDKNEFTTRKSLQLYFDYHF